MTTHQQTVALGELIAMYSDKINILKMARLPLPITFLISTLNQIRVESPDKHRPSVSNVVQIPQIPLDGNRSFSGIPGIFNSVERGAFFSSTTFFKLYNQ